MLFVYRVNTDSCSRRHDVSNDVVNS